MQLPHASEPEKVGSYPAEAAAGGGYVWDEVLEYRVWCHLRDGADDITDGSDYFYAFATFEEAQAAAKRLAGAAEPLALILQREYIEELRPGVYRHMKQSRTTEWPVEFLSRPRRDEHTIPDFLSSDAPANRLEIIRGQVPRRQ